MKGAGISITGSSNLINKSNHLGSLRSVKDEENRKPVNMAQLLMEQRKKFLQQQEEKKKENEKEVKRKEKIRKLRGPTILVIDEVSEGGSDVDLSDAPWEEDEDEYGDEDDELEMNIMVDAAAAKPARKSMGDKPWSAMHISVERSKTVTATESS